MQRKCYRAIKPKLLHKSSEIRIKRQFCFWAIFSVPIPNDVPVSITSSFLSQLTVVPTSGLLHFHVPTNAPSTATGLTSLNDVTIAHVPTTTATTTATMTLVPATATTNTPKYQIDKCKATQTQHKTRSPSILHPTKKLANNATLNLLLPFNQDNSAITISSLLLSCHSARPAIMTTTNANFSLQLIVESFSTGAKQVAPATILNDSFKLIDVLASEGAIFAPHIFEDAFTLANKLNHEGAWALATSCQTSKLIVIYFKWFLHFRKDSLLQRLRNILRVKMGATAGTQRTHRPRWLPTAASQWTHRSCQLH